MGNKEIHEKKINEIKASLKNIENNSKIDLMDENKLAEYIYNNYYLKQHLSSLKISSMLNTSNNSIYKLFNKNGFKMRDNHEKGKLYHCNVNYFEIINTEEKAYWLGFLYADGYIQSRRFNDGRKLGISLGIKDINHLRKFKDCISYDGDIKIYKTGKSSYKEGIEYCRILITEEKLVSDVIDKGCIEHKSNIKKFPNENQVPQNLLKPFIRGYFDGNGSVTITKSNPDKNSYVDSYSISFVSTDDMLLHIQDILLKERIIKHTYNFSKRKEYQEVSSFDFGGNFLSYKFLEWLYGGANIYLDRKYERYLNLKKYVLSRQEIL